MKTKEIVALIRRKGSLAVNRHNKTSYALRKQCMRLAKAGVLKLRKKTDNYFIFESV